MLVGPGVPGPYVDQSADVTIAAGETAVVDFNLSRGGSISGAFVPPPGQPSVSELTNFGVGAYDRNGTLVHQGRIIPASDPATQWPAGYIEEGLAPGQYYIRFSDPVSFPSRFTPGGAGGHIQDHIVGLGPCITQDCDVRRGLPIEVGPLLAPVTGVDIPLVPGGSIELIDPAPFGSRGAYELYDQRGARVAANFRPENVPFGTSNLATFLGLPAGIYFLRTNDARDCRVCPAIAGRPIEVRAPGVAILTLPAMPASDPGRRISGTVRDAATMAPLSIITVRALAADGRIPEGVAITNMLGRFEFNSVAPGQYVIRTTNRRGYAERGDGVSVTIDAADVNVDVALDRAGYVMATAIDAEAVPVASIPITFFDSVRRPVGNPLTDPSGSADVQLPPGTYYARAEPVDGRVMHLYGAGACARGQCDVTSGTAVPFSLSISPRGTLRAVGPPTPRIWWSTANCAACRSARRSRATACPGSRAPPFTAATTSRPCEPTATDARPRHRSS